jgi:hypothetical protein
MKKYLYKILGNLLILLFICFIFIYITQNNYWRNRLPVIKKNIAEENAQKTDTFSIVLGSSHAFLGIHTKHMQGKYLNLSSIGQSFQEDYIILKRLKEIKLKYKTIILPYTFISNFHFLYNTPMVGNETRVYDYVKAYNYTYPLTPLHAKRHFLLLSEIGKASLDFDFHHMLDSFGNLDNKCSGEKKINNFEDVWFRHSQARDFNNSNAYFDSIIQFCKTNNKKIYFVVMPMTKRYYDSTLKTPFNRHLEKLISRNQSANIYFFDFRKYFSHEQEETMFYDEDHLSPCGRNVFSNSLDSAIRRTKQ